jgi:SAM-dependent methyltransferase
VLDRPDRDTAEALARLYDLDLAEDPGDVDLYFALAARADGRVLELAAGTGRLAVPLALAGHRVTAVDVDPAMLGRARARADEAGVRDGSMELVEADVIGLDLPAKDHALAFIGLNSIMLLGSREGQRAAFRAMASHLRPGGIAAVDAWLPDAEDLARFDGRLMLEWTRQDPDDGAVVTKSASAQHDAASATVSLTTVFEASRQGEDVRRWVRRDRLRLVSADELAGFASDAGLQVELVAGGYDLAPLDAGSERVVLVAERP